MDMGEIKDIVRATVEERFPGVQIEDIWVKEREDDDDDAFVEIVVVIEKPRSELDREELVGFIRHLKTNLMKKEIKKFPLLSFVNSNEARKLKREFV